MNETIPTTVAAQITGSAAEAIFARMNMTLGSYEGATAVGAGGPQEVKVPLIGVQVARGPIVNVIGVEVSTVDVTLLYNQDALAPQWDGTNLPLAPWLLNGGLDGARLKINRFFCAAGNSVPVGWVNLFIGRVAEIGEITGTQASMQAVSTLELLNIKMPRNMYQAQCVWTVYDAGCRLGKGAFAQSGVILAGSNLTHIVHNIAMNAGVMDQGFFQLVDANMATPAPSRTILTQNATHIVLAYPLPVVPANGKAFKVNPGCNRSLEACTALGNNQNIRFFPYIPTPETSY